MTEEQNTLSAAKQSPAKQSASWKAELNETSTAPADSSAAPSLSLDASGSMTQKDDNGSPSTTLASKRRPSRSPSPNRARYRERGRYDYRERGRHYDDHHDSRNSYRPSYAPYGGSHDRGYNRHVGPGNENRYNRDTEPFRKYGGDMYRQINDSKKNPSLEELSQRNKLLTLKEFLEIMNPNSVDELKAIENYSNYKSLFLEHHLYKFFENHKNEEWFVEKYHPELSANWRQEQIQAAESRHRLFFNAYFDGKLNAFDLDDVARSHPVAPNTNNAEPSRDTGAEEEDFQNETMQSSSSSQQQQQQQQQQQHSLAALDILAQIVPVLPTLAIKSINPTIKRAQLLEIFSKLTGFKHLILSAPNPYKKFHRFGWAVFEVGTDLDAHQTSLQGTRIEGFELHMSVYRTYFNRTRAAAEEHSEASRIRFDLQLVRRLVRWADKHKGLENSILDPLPGTTHPRSLAPLTAHGQGHEAPLSDAEEGEEQETRSRRKSAPSRSHDDRVDPETSDLSLVKQELDLLLLYLRIVHTTCYYCSLSVHSLEELHKDCGHLHLRRSHSGSSTSLNSSGLSVKLNNDKVEDWLKHVPLASVELDQSHAHLTATEQDVQKALKTRFIETVEEGDPKSRCSLCAKLFKTAEFVVKHLFLKHEAEVAIVKTDLAMYQRFLSNTEEWTAFILSPAPPSSSSWSSPSMYGGGHRSSHQDYYQPPDYRGHGNHATGYYGGGGGGGGGPPPSSSSRDYRSHSMRTTLYGQGAGPMRSRYVPAYSQSHAHASSYHDSDPYQRQSYRSETTLKSMSQRPDEARQHDMASQRPLRSYSDLDAPSDSIQVSELEYE